MSEEASRTVYLDYAATTPCDPRVVEVMLPFFTERYGNPNSLYALGRDGYRALEAARESFAASINAANPTEVIFTGAGTESDNAAVVGISREDGIVHPEDLAAALRDDTVLVSVMHANNELGTVQPIKELAALAHTKD